jgi:hypothetical protein
MVEILSRCRSNTVLDNFKSENNKLFIPFASASLALFLFADIEFIDMNYTADWMQFTTLYGLLYSPFELTTGILT